MRTNTQYKYKFVTQEFVDKEGYLSLEEDIMVGGVKEATFIVMNHLPDDRLKTDVKYYTHRKRSSYTSHEGNPEGSEWVYVLAHPQEPDLLKIGYTSKEPTQRLKEINSQTGVAGEYRIVYIYRTVNGQRLETAVHSLLKEKRIHPRKEHFQTSREEVIQIIKEAGHQYG